MAKQLEYSLRDESNYETVESGDGGNGGDDVKPRGMSSVNFDHHSLLFLIINHNTVLYLCSLIVQSHGRH